MKRKLIKTGLLALSFLITPLFGDAFPFDPPKNFTLTPKYIGLHHPVTAANITAQLYFDQGLTLMYAFNHDAAYWSFLKGTEADPNCAMNYWGMAISLGPNINMNITPERAKVALNAVDKAKNLFSSITESEKDYITALTKRYSTDPNADLNKLAESYSDAMRILSNKYPDDPDAAVLFAESLLDVQPWNQWSLDGKPLKGTLEAVFTLEKVLKADPMHLGANHFYIHAIEASKHPERALMSAERLKTLLPASGHILHMPSHIYILVGDYHEAAMTNENAVAADREYIREYGEGGIYPIHYLSHNLYFLTRAYTMEGSYTDALQAAEELSELYLPHFKGMPELEYYAPAQMLVMLHFNQWDDLIVLPQPDPAMQITNVMWRFCRAVAFAGLKNQKKALEEKQSFLEARDKLPKDAPFGYNKADKIFKIAENFLDGKISELQGDKTKAIGYLTQAMMIQNTLSYNEPPDWFFPVGVSLGGALLRQDKFQDAERIFREDLTRHPRNGRALFGLKESLAGQSKTHDLFWVNQQFEQAWRYSDIRLTVNEL